MKRYGVAEAGNHPDAAGLLHWVRAHWRTYLALMIGLTSPAAVSQPMAAWLPEIIRRDFGWSISYSAIAAGLMGMLATALGIVLAPFLMSRFAAGRAARIAVLIALTGNGLASIAMIQTSATPMLVCSLTAILALSA